MNDYYRNAITNQLIAKTDWGENERISIKQPQKAVKKRKKSYNNSNGDNVSNVNHNCTNSNANLVKKPRASKNVVL